MAANGMMDNYDGLAKKYYDYFQGSKMQVCIGKPSVAFRSHPSSSISCESCPQNILQTPPLLRRMPRPSLSPIPEEMAESYPETLVFSTSIGKFSEDSGYFDSLCLGILIIRSSRFEYIFKDHPIPNLLDGWLVHQTRLLPQPKIFISSSFKTSWCWSSFVNSPSSQSTEGKISLTISSVLLLKEVA